MSFRRRNEKMLSLLSLPEDIRKQIYKHHFRCNKSGEELKLDYKPRPTWEYTKDGNRVERTETWHPYIPPSTKRLRTELSLLLTCRDIEKELDDIVFGYSKLLFIHPKALSRFSSMVPDAGLASIRNLKLEMSIYEREHEQLWSAVFNDVVIAKLRGLKNLDIAIKFSRDIQAKALLHFRNIFSDAVVATIRTFKLEVSIDQQEYQQPWFAAIKDVIIKLTGLKSVDIVIRFSQYLWNGPKDIRRQQWKDAMEQLGTSKMLQECKLTSSDS